MIRKILTILISLVISTSTFAQYYMMLNPQETIKQELIKTVDEHIKNTDISIHFVEAGLEYDIDICFMMAQAKLETNYGVLGAGKTRKSMFGVASRRYSTYKDAIYDYCELLNKNYLVNGKTEQHLLQNYVNKSGYRYAQSRSYEKELQHTYKNITGKTKIQKLQNEYIRVTEKYMAKL